MEKLDVGREEEPRKAQCLQEPLERNVKLAKPFAGARIAGAIERKCVECVFSS
ncbi:hypothetical protein KDH_27290 [Dictyobacter sp. S3.2.2.5]|uniref:Uncharacterized protein n=1 Tax=Dictyobacter halimunensis TaxID=3026934 RepID=A0ABQ6FRF6_9CHLR|nr:hypothetical protein KDH_27290 [Dictyobacter sp. S3.2.2.5]